MTRDLPIFPLPVVLFPGAAQALHIFEPRYRQLLADCLESDRRFGIAYVPPVEDPAAAAVPDPGDVGCVAVIRSADRVPDGRGNILTEGERRFVLLEWLAADRLYRVARVEEFEDALVLPDAEPLATQVRDAFGRVVRLQATEAGPELSVPIDLPADPTALSFHVAAEIEVDASTKRALQAERDTSARLRRLLALLGPLLAEAEQRAAASLHARGNGRRQHSERAT